MASHLDNGQIRLDIELTPNRLGRIVLGGLAFPFLALMAGKIFLPNTPLHPLDRTVLGGKGSWACSSFHLGLPDSQ